VKYSIYYEKYKRKRFNYKFLSIFLSIFITIFLVNMVFAASPFSWDITKPANTDPVSIFPALYRGDVKGTLGGSGSATGGILGTLNPYGTPTTGFRENQINDDSWICQNSYYTSTSSSSRDATGSPSLCATQELSIQCFRWMSASSGTNPIASYTEIARFCNTGVFFGGRPWADARAYGAVGDGSTDDTTALTSWINACQASGNGICFLPPSANCYIFSSLPTLTTAVTLLGSGFNSCLQHKTGSTGNGITIGNITGSYPWITIQNIKLKGNGSDSGNGIEYPTTTNNAYVTFIRVFVTGWSGNGFDLLNWQSCSAFDIVSQGNGGWGVQMGHPGGGSGVSNADNFIGGNIAGNTLGGFSFENTDRIQISGMSIQGNTGPGAQLGGLAGDVAESITFNTVDFEQNGSTNGTVYVSATGTNLSKITFIDIFITVSTTNGNGINFQGGSTAQLIGGEIGQNGTGFSLLLGAGFGGGAPFSAAIIMGTQFDGANSLSCGNTYCATFVDDSLHKPTIVLKTGSHNSTDYSTSSTTFVDVDATNLAYTVTIPTGKKLLIQSSGTFYASGNAGTGEQCVVAINDSVSGNIHVVYMGSFTNGIVPFSLSSVESGDGLSHTIKLRFKAPSTNPTCNVANGGAGDNGANFPTMTFLMDDSN